MERYYGGAEARGNVTTNLRERPSGPLTTWPQNLVAAVRAVLYSLAGDYPQQRVSRAVAMISSPRRLGRFAPAIEPLTSVNTLPTFHVSRSALAVPSAERKCRSGHKGNNAMRASIETHRLLLLAVGLLCLLSIFVLIPPRSASAKTRPPIEMGDPDGTGDQKPGRGPAASTALVVKSSEVTSAASSSLWVGGSAFGKFFERNRVLYVYLLGHVFSRR